MARDEIRRTAAAIGELAKRRSDAIDRSLRNDPPAANPAIMIEVRDALGLVALLAECVDALTNGAAK